MTRHYNNTGKINKAILYLVYKNTHYTSCTCIYCTTVPICICHDEIYIFVYSVLLRPFFVFIIFKKRYIQSSIVLLLLHYYYYIFLSFFHSLSFHGCLFLFKIHNFMLGAVYSVWEDKLMFVEFYREREREFFTTKKWYRISRKISIDFCIT